MRADLLEHGIGVSVLCPGLVNTNIFESQRNRPEDMPGASLVPLAARNLSGDQLAQQLEEMRASALDPAVVGDMVLHAIREDEFYIFTHPDLEAMTDARKDEMAAAFARWRSYREERGV